MSNLKELIDRLYDEVIQSQDADTPDTTLTEEWEESDFDTERLRGALTEMASCLQPEDLQDGQDAEALDHDTASRLLAQWGNLCSSMEGLRRHMQELDADIIRMQPWGDFDMVKLEQLRQHDCQVLFWTMPIDIFASQATESWAVDSQVQLINEDNALAYFITIQLGNEEVAMPQEAKRVEICPCPVSTLIMLQTRDKDSLKRLQTMQGDFALAHYAELRETLRTLLPAGSSLPGQKVSRRQQLKARLKKLFRK